MSPEGEARREMIAAILSAMRELDDKLGAYEKLLRFGKAFSDDYRNGCIFARTLKAHAAMLEQLAADHDAFRELETARYVRELNHQAAVQNHMAATRAANPVREVVTEKLPE